MAKSEIERITELLRDNYRTAESERDKKNKEIAKAKARIKVAEENYDKAMSEFSSAAEENDIVTYKETREKVNDAQAVLEYERKKLQQILARPVITPEVCNVRVSAAESLVHNTVAHTVRAIVERMENDKRTLDNLSEMYKEGVKLVEYYKCDMAGLIPKRPGRLIADLTVKLAYDDIERSIITPEAKDLQGYLVQASDNWFFDQYGK